MSIFTRAARSDLSLPIVDAAIGRAAFLAVTELRTWCRTEWGPRAREAWW